MNSMKLLSLADKITSLCRKIEELNCFLNENDEINQIILANEDTQIYIYRKDAPEAFNSFGSIIKECINIYEKEKEKIRLQMIKELGDTND